MIKYIYRHTTAPAMEHEVELERVESFFFQRVYHIWESKPFHSYSMEGYGRHTVMCKTISTEENGDIIGKDYYEIDIEEFGLSYYIKRMLNSIRNWNNIRKCRKASSDDALPF